MSSTVNVDIPSGKSLPITIGGDGTAIQTDSEVSTDSKIDLKPVKVDTDSKVDLKTDSKVDLKTDSKVDLKIEPLKIDLDTDSKIDVKPLAVDTCTTVKLAPLPATRVEQPYCTHFGFTYMGMELFGFNLSGKSGMFLSSPPKSQYHSMEPEEPHRPPCDEPRSKEPQSHSKSGLRVRINDK